MKKMDLEKSNIFSNALGVMKLLGLIKPSSNRWQKCIFGVLKYIMLYIAVHFILITGLAVLGDKEYYIKLETLSGMVPGSSMTYRHFLLALNFPSVLSLMRRINALVDELVSEYGPEKTIIPWKRMCSTVKYMSISVVFLLLVPAYSYSYYKYFTDGVVVAPYEVYIPFETKDRIHAVVWYEVVSFIAQALTLVSSNTVIGTIVIAVTGATQKIRERFETVHPSNVGQLKQTIAWHAEVITIVEEANSLFGSVMMIDCLFSIVHISVSGYLLLKAGIENGINLHKYVFLNMMCITIPSFFCICGHIVKLENEKLHKAIYQNEWFLLAPKQRNDLILPANLTNKGIVLQYRRAVNFDLLTYLAVIKQSYSFLAILKLMDG